MTKPDPLRRILGKVVDVMDAEIATGNAGDALGALGVKTIAQWLDGELEKRALPPPAAGCTCGAIADVAGVELHRADCALTKSSEETKP